jgi:hypothetical protein
MILVTVELLPGGRSHLRRTIATMEVSNVSDLACRSDYRVEISEEENRLAGTKPLSWTVHVRDHDRRTSVWRLIEAAMRAWSDLK